MEKIENYLSVRLLMQGKVKQKSFFFNHLFTLINFFFNLGSWEYYWKSKKILLKISSFFLILIIPIKIER